MNPFLHVVFLVGFLAVCYLNALENSPNDDPRIHLVITSEKNLESSADQVIFISCLIKNSANQFFKDSLELVAPEGWIILPSPSIELQIPAHDETLQIFGVKIPSSIPAGRYSLTTRLAQMGIQSDSVDVEIPCDKNLRLHVEDLLPLYFLFEPIELKIKLVNSGNTPLRMQITAQGDPICLIGLERSLLELAPKEVITTKLLIEPTVLREKEKQFIKLKVIDRDTHEMLAQDTVTLCFSTNEENVDPWIKIPAYLSSIALGDNNDIVFALEYSGGGIIDQERSRYIDYIFRIPTKTRNVVYNVDQRLFFCMGQPKWEINLGDTVYSLSPLTQRYRYGRGGGIDIDQERYLFGAHYTQNIFNNDYNPKEAGAYFGIRPDQNLILTGNYLHRKVQEEPEAHIGSLASEHNLNNRTFIECEVGNNFQKNAHDHNTTACRFNIRGKVSRDTWFDVEKIYAGKAFLGYYNDINLFSALFDIPFNCPMRANLSMVHLKQNFQQGFECSADSHLLQRQRQYSANLSYNFCNHSSISINGLLLRAWDHGEGGLYNFNQQWLGGTTSFCYRGWSLIVQASWGQQEDYLTKHRESFLQKYWCYASKQVTSRLHTTLFCEEGNTNYYDARPWRSTFGASLGFHYSPRGIAELYVQRVQNKPDMYELNQASFRLTHNFRNRHVLKVSSEYFHYQTHYPNDFLFYISYTVPLWPSIIKSRDIGDLEGYIQDTETRKMIPDVMVNAGGKRCLSDINGMFSFRNLKTGLQNLKVEYLPQHLICENLEEVVAVVGAKNTHIIIPVVSPCAIHGKILLYEYEDPINFLRNREEQDKHNLVFSRGLQGISITARRAEGNEEYTTLSKNQGEFSFNNLRPGHWLIEIQEGQLPENHYIDNHPISLILNPKEERELALPVFPKRREILPIE